MMPAIMATSSTTAPTMMPMRRPSGTVSAAEPEPDTELAVVAPVIPERFGSTPVVGSATQTCESSALNTHDDPEAHVPHSRKPPQLSASWPQVWLTPQPLSGVHRHLPIVTLQTLFAGQVPQVTLLQPEPTNNSPHSRFSAEHSVVGLQPIRLQWRSPEGNWVQASPAAVQVPQSMIPPQPSGRLPSLHFAPSVLQVSRRQAH